MGAEKGGLVRRSDFMKISDKERALLLTGMSIHHYSPKQDEEGAGQGRVGGEGSVRDMACFIPEAFTGT